MEQNKNYNFQDINYINLFLFWLLFAISFNGSYIININQKQSFEVFLTLPGIFLLSLKDILAGVVALSASYYIFPRYLKAEPTKKVVNFEKLMFSLSLLISSLYLINVFLIGQRNIEFELYYTQLRYIIPLQIFSFVFIQQAGTNIFLLDLNRNRFGDNKGYLLTVGIFSLAHLPCFLLMSLYWAIFIIVSGTIGMALFAKIRIKYNSNLGPFFIHYLFHITVTYSLSLKTLLDLYLVHLF